jgi:hypothetical protein
LLVLWSDGSNSYLGVLDVGNAAILSGAKIVSGKSSITTLVELTGVDVSTAGTFTDANYDIF